MTIKQLPPAARKSVNRTVRQLGIQAYDCDNLYPQNVRDIVGASACGSGCLDRYINYIKGDGLASSYFANLVVNAEGETLADLVTLLARDMGTYQGIALHVNYNVLGRITSLHAVPFENARLGEYDEEGVIEKIALHPDWTGELEYGGKRMRVTRDNIDYVDTFRPEAAPEQMRDAGGPDAYLGQVLYSSTAGYLRYPLALFDSVLTDMSTDEGLSNLMLRNARNNFLPACAFVHLKGNGDMYDEDGRPSREEGSSYSETLRSLQGDTNALNVLDIEVERMDEKPEVVQFAARNIDKDFTATDDAVKERIYARFNQEGFLSIRLGKVGFSGTLVRDVNDDYARSCVDVQKRITRALMTVLKWWALPLAEEPTEEALTIVPLTYSVASSEKINE